MSSRPCVPWLRAAILGLSLFHPAVWAQTSAQDSGAKQSMKNAGTDTKAAAQQAGHGVKQGTKKGYHKTRHGTRKAVHKVQGKPDTAANNPRQ